MFFIKLNQKIIIDEYPKGDHYIGYGDHGVINYYRTIRPSNALKILPKEYRNKFQTFLLEITNNIPPHIDSVTTCTINFYIESGSYRTNFWNVINREQTYKVANQTNGEVYNKDAVELADSFFAESGEVYLLDVTKPHSVESATPGLKRKALCLQTASYNFEQVKDMLKETGFLN